MPQRVMRKAGDLASRRLHGDVEGSRQTSHSHVVQSVEPGEEPIQHRRFSFRGIPCIAGAMGSLSQKWEVFETRQWGSRLRVIETRDVSCGRLREGPHGWSNNRWRHVQG